MLVRYILDDYFQILWQHPKYTNRDINRYITVTDKVLSDGAPAVSDHFIFLRGAYKACDRNKVKIFNADVMYIHENLSAAGKTLDVEGVYEV